MYVLNGRPTGGAGLDAFQALDDVFGNDEFSAEEAISTLVEVNELEPSEAAAAFRGLVSGGYVSEV